MSNQLREALSQYDDGVAGTHQVSELAAAARKWLAVTESGSIQWCEKHKSAGGPIWCDAKFVVEPNDCSACWFVSKFLVVVSDD